MLSVTRIYRYYKQFGIATEIMGASFRNVGQILALSGCDLLTISPELLNKLAATEGDAPAQLRAGDGANGIARIASDEISFRGLLNEDAMATEKLSEGIRLFVADAVKLDALIEAARLGFRAAGKGRGSDPAFSFRQPRSPPSAVVVRMDLQGFQEARHHVVGSHRGRQLDQQLVAAHGLARGLEHGVGHLHLTRHGVGIGQHGALARVSAESCQPSSASSCACVTPSFNAIGACWSAS